MNHSSERLWTKSFVTLTICNLLLFIGLQMTLSTLPVYAKDSLSATSVQISLVTSLFALSAIASRLFAGKAMEKGGRNLLIFLGVAICLTAVAGYYWSGTIMVLLLMRMLFGIGFGMASTAFPTMASDVIPIRRMGEGLGYFGLSTSLAMSAGPLIGLSLLQGPGFSSLLLCTGLALALILPLGYRLTRSLPAHHKEPAPAAIPGPKGNVFRKLLIPGLLNLLLSVSYGGLLGFLALYGQEAHLDHIAYFFLFNAVAIVIIRPVSGKIYDRFGPAALLIPGSLFIIGGLLLLSFASSTAALFPAALCYGIGFGSMQPALQTWMIQSVDPLQRGTANGMFLNSLDFGVAVGTMILGSVALYNSYAVMYRYSALAPLLLLVIYSIVLITKRRSRSASSSVQVSR
ncbi:MULTISPECIES: MFS transporter [unclassified Paenibacillus]|uniref:MFS transporter n=1 Tax=unclassified Paenibacillus TaxID=185978 RepID=UPI0024057102|nr:MULTISPECIES: MFS transporter [unclassified Paenibacillus]MDF9842951.1 MFS family permease [Paenibacillus sp. PastF-2]MDF9849539.1 MFS family permease [Paenibacillus sp. PastM-2]MDF9856086.1 MFS family permease [Paenibacillus sp. PastF-1]MDH6481382.1 MFS family permease [Paenibacillus sp. PastH-2]MDH6508775.1 MFS family permease [Paenibacillus sp. PastM-3]